MSTPDSQPSRQELGEIVHQLPVSAPEVLISHASALAILRDTESQGSNIRTQLTQQGKLVLAQILSVDLELPEDVTEFTITPAQLRAVLKRGLIIGAGQALFDTARARQEVTELEANFEQ